MCGNVENNKKDGQRGRVSPPKKGHSLDKLQSISESESVGKVYRVMVVDDSLLPRVAARALINASPSLRLVGEAASGQEALQIVDALRPDLLLVDVHMP